MESAAVIGGEASGEPGFSIPRSLWMALCCGNPGESTGSMVLIDPSNGACEVEVFKIGGDSISGVEVSKESLTGSGGDITASRSFFVGYGVSIPLAIRSLMLVSSETLSNLLIPGRD